MRGQIANKATRFINCRLRRHGFAVRLAGCFFSVAIASVFVGLAPEANLIWVANGVLLAYLLLAPRKRWPAYLCSAYAAQFIGGFFAGHHGIVSGLILTLLNVAESLVSALLLRRRSSDLPDFTAPAYIARFLAFGVFAGPMVTGAVDALVSPLWHIGSPLWHAPSPGTEFLQWVAADALGACVVTPACVAIFRTRFRDSLFSLKHWAHLLPVALTAFAIFQHARMPLAFLLYPLLVIVLFRLGLGWAALATLVVAGVASSFTVRGQGPFAASVPNAHFESAISVQLYIASAMIILYSVSVVLEDLRATQRRLQEIAALHKLVTENSRDVIIIADFEGNRSYVSSSASNWGGYTPQDMLKSKSLELVHPEDRPKIREVMKHLRSGADGALIECRVRRHDGSYVWTESNLRTIRDPISGAPTGIINNAREITERKRAEKELADYQEKLAAALEAMTDSVFISNTAGEIVNFNKAFATVHGLRNKSEYPRNLSEFFEVGELLTVDGKVAPLDARPTIRALRGETATDVEYKFRRKDTGETWFGSYSFSPIREKNGSISGSVTVARDITEHKRVEQQLEEAFRTVETLAITDALTGLANRRRFDQCLFTEWRRAMRDRKPLSLLIVDADLFKSYNDTYGHLRGDSCLKQIAEGALDVVARPGDLVARFGGEEFAIILPNTGPSGALQLAQDICAVMRNRQLPHSSNPLGIVTVSVGCATLIPQPGKHAADLIDYADKALYQAKRTGRNRACSYQPEAKVVGEEIGRLAAVKSV